MARKSGMVTRNRFGGAEVKGVYRLKLKFVLIALKSRLVHAQEWRSITFKYARTEVMCFLWMLVNLCLLEDKQKAKLGVVDKLVIYDIFLYGFNMLNELIYVILVSNWIILSKTRELWFYIFYSYFPWI